MRPGRRPVATRFSWYIICSKPDASQLFPDFLAGWIYHDVAFNYNRSSACREQSPYARAKVLWKAVKSGGSACSDQVTFYEGEPPASLLRDMTEDYLGGITRERRHS